MIRTLALTLLLLLCGKAMPAETASIASNASKGWDRVTLRSISADGSYGSYLVRNKDSGQNDLWLLNVETGERTHVAAGALGTFSTDGKWYAAVTQQGELSLINILSKQVTSIPCASDFRFAEDSSFLFVAYDWRGNEGVCGGEITTVKLSDLSTRKVSNVSSYSFSPKARSIAYVSSDEGKSSLKVWSLKSATPQTSLALNNPGIQRLTWNSSGTVLAFLEPIAAQNGDAKDAIVHVYADVLARPKWRRFDHKTVPNFPLNSAVKVSDLQISDAGSNVVFALRSTKNDNQEPITKDAEIVRIWHFLDRNVVSDRKRGLDASGLAAWNFESEAFASISREGSKFLAFSGDGTHVITSEKDQMSGLFEDRASILSTDLRTGHTRTVLEGQPTDYLSYVIPSPQGRYFAYFRESEWWTYEFLSGVHTNTTGDLIADVQNSRADRSSTLHPFGSPGWTSDEELLVYDEYDIWLVLPRGGPAERITDGLAEHKRYRFHTVENQPLDPGALPTQTLRGAETFEKSGKYVLSAFGTNDKKSGFSTFSFGEKPTDVYLSDVHVSGVFYTSDQSVFLYQWERFDVPPTIARVDAASAKTENIFTSNAHFRRGEWGQAELVDYVDQRGTELQGILYSPASPDVGASNPLIVSVYERQSNGLHQFRYPTSEYLSVSSFTKDGYFVLLPDIAFGSNDPGLDALSSVTAAVTKVLEKGSVNPKAVGITGASWGGYETAFIISRTNMFAAAVAGSAPTDLISLNLSVEPGNGIPVLWRFEQDQLRIRVPLHADSASFINNSPVLGVRTIETPLLSWFGEKDPLIPSSQAVEMYNAMRRAGKQHVLLLYPNEGHVLRSKTAAADLDSRVRAWFGHFLKGAPASHWILHGERSAQ